MTSLFKRIIMSILSFINLIISKDKDKIVIYGRSMLNDNAEAIIDYLLLNNFQKKYQIYLLIKNTVQHPYKKDVNVVSGIAKTIFLTLRAKYIFHTHGMSLCSHKPYRGQIIFNLWHGTPLKAIGAMIGHIVHPETDSFFLCSSPYVAEINKACFKIKDEQVYIGSNPRNDYLFKIEDVKNIMGWSNYSKVVVFMPTFRKSKAVDRLDAGKEFPILNELNISEVNKKLKEKNVLLVIKPHPYQDNIQFLQKHYSNISIIYNENIREKGVKLYVLLANTDALITDFSSVYFDYLLTNKPIGFAVDDMISYGKNRGYTVDDPIKIMPGMHIQTVDELIDFVDSVIKGNDDYLECRNNINKLFNVSNIPNASQKLIEFLGI